MFVQSGWSGMVRGNTNGMSRIYWIRFRFWCFSPLVDDNVVMSFWFRLGCFSLLFDDNMVVVWFWLWFRLRLFFDLYYALCHFYCPVIWIGSTKIVSDYALIYCSNQAHKHTARSSPATVRPEVLFGVGADGGFEFGGEFF